jgi:hypothetical protein
MKSLHRINAIIYAAIIALYIYQPILGALAQIGLGIFQIVLAIMITQNMHKIKPIVRKHLKMYWLSIIIWIFSIALISMFSNIDHVFRSMLLVCPMLIGFYFVIITYLNQKNI